MAESLLGRLWRTRRLTPHVYRFVAITTAAAWLAGCGDPNEDEYYCDQVEERCRAVGNTECVAKVSEARTFSGKGRICQVLGGNDCRCGGD